jgi:ankyrin repeat protein
MPSGEAFQTTTLSEAAASGRLEVARLLLDAGADASRAGGNGATPLMAAAWPGQLEVLQLLLGRGAAVDGVDPGTSATAFHYACDRNQAGCAEALARAGCDVRIKEKNGFTGRELAEAKGHAAVVARLRAVVAEQLRAAQAARPAAVPEPAAVSGDGGPAPKLVAAVREGDGPAVAQLLGAGADPNALVPMRAPSGEVVQTTALREAAGYGRLEVVRLLLDAGADPSLTGGNGCTPLMVAVGEGQLEVLRLLLRWGAAVDTVEPASGCTAFHSACFNNQAGCAEALVRGGCDVGLKGKSGQTGRELAEVHDSKDVTRRLRALARQPFVGVLVELAGLVGAAAHNGKRATVMSEWPSHFNVIAARAYVVCTLHEHRRTYACVAVEWRWN